jgi:hypothetical protein
MILFYGGKNHIRMIEYDSSYFENYKNVLLFEKKLQKYNDKFNTIVTNNNDYITIDEINEILHIMLSNYINNFFIKISPKSYFNIKKVIDINNINNINNLIMIVFNHNNVKNIELIINRENIQNSNNLGNENKITGYFYNLTNKISVTSIYDIYNNNDVEIFITIFIVKRPYWYY